MYRAFGKRLFDIAGSLLALIALAPVLFLVALAIKLEDRGPVIYRQQRVGKNGREFEFLKFRSMPAGTASIESRDAGDLPITRVGRLIRRTNIDELPQLFNILRGEMSLVGPRPPVPAQTGLLRMRQENGSLSLRPGLTGLAQINAYDRMPATEKARWDGEYARELSLRHDLAIVLKTFGYLGKPPPAY